MDYPEIQVKNEPFEYAADGQIAYSEKVKEEPVDVCDSDYDYFSPELMASIPSEPLFPDLIKTDSDLFSVAEFLNTDLSPSAVKLENDLCDEALEHQTTFTITANTPNKKELPPPAYTGMVNIGNFEGNVDQNKRSGKLIIARPKKLPTNTTTTTTKPYAKSTNSMECQYCGAKFSSAKWFSKHFCPQKGEQLHGISVVNLVSAPQLQKKADSGDVLKAKQRNIYSTRKCRVCDQSFPTFSLMFEHFMSHYNLKKDTGNTSQGSIPNVQLKAAGPSVATAATQGNFKRKLDADDVILLDNSGGMTIKQQTTAKYEYPPDGYPIKIAPASSSGRQGIKICKECGQSFSSQSQLVDHFLTHYNLTLKRNPATTTSTTTAVAATDLPSATTTAPATKKPQVIYACNQCPGQFPSITRLRQHQQNVHSEEEAVQCKVCDSWFNSQKYLLRHMQRKHEATAECNVCHQKFTEMELPNHFLKHYNMKL